MTEGSVYVDGVSSPPAEGGDTSDTSTSKEGQQGDTGSQTEGQQTQGEGTEGQQTDGQTDGSTLQTKDKPETGERTEKGTHADPDPLSRANQELANERAKIKKYEEVLNNPTLLKGYLSQFNPQQEEKQREPEKKEDEISPDQVQTTADLQKYLKQEKDKVEGKVKELNSRIQQVTESGKVVATANRIGTDISTVREKYPELNPKDAAYNQTLDAAVGLLFEKTDWDAEKKAFRGNASLVEIADIVMSAAGSSKKQGSQEAQTIVKDRRNGQAIAGSSSAKGPDESNMTPAQTIASRIQAARKSAGRR